MRDHFTVSLDRFTILWYTFTDASKSSSEGPGSGSIDPFVSLITPLIALRRGIHSKETPWEKQISFFFSFLLLSLSLSSLHLFTTGIYISSPKIVNGAPSSTERFSPLSLGVILL